MLSRFEVRCPPTSLDAGAKSPFPLVTAKTISTKSEALPERSSLAETMMSPGSQALVTARHSVPGSAHNFSWELALAFPESSVNTVIWIAPKTIIKYQNAQGSQLKSLGHWTPSPPPYWCYWAMAFTAWFSWMSLPHGVMFVLKSSPVKVFANLYQWSTPGHSPQEAGCQTFI